MCYVYCITKCICWKTRWLSNTFCTVDVMLVWRPARWYCCLSNGRYLCWIPYWKLDLLICWNIEENFIWLYFSKCDLSTVSVYSLEHYFFICHFGLHFAWKERVNMKRTSHNLDSSDDWTVISDKKLQYICIWCSFVSCSVKENTVI